MNNRPNLATRVASAAALLATALVLAAAPAPARADDGMNTPEAQVFVGPEVPAFTWSETITQGPTATVSTVVTEGVVTYRGRTHRAVCRDGVVYLARNGRRLGPRAAATFRVR